MRLVFLGPPGAGKGTQAAVMADRFGVTHASTGDIFRQAIAGETELGRTVKDYLDSGKLVPDSLTSRVVEEMVIDITDSYILDGYPRTIGQAEDFERMLSERDAELDAVVYFKLSDEEAVERLTGRRVCSGCGQNYHVKFMPPAEEGKCDKCGAELRIRSDSSESVVRDRLKEYHQKTQPLVDFYRERDLLHTISASPPPDEVTAATEAFLRQIAGD